MYPERFGWANTEEAVFDWLVDDRHKNHRYRHQLFGSDFNQIGIACNCHVNFGEFCIVELGLDVQEMIPREHNNMNVHDGWVYKESTERYDRRNLQHLADEWPGNLGKWTDSEELRSILLPFSWSDGYPDWWEGTDEDHEWMERYYNTYKPFLVEFKLPNDPTCYNDQIDEGYCPATFGERTVWDTNQDTGPMASFTESLWNSINTYRNDPGTAHATTFSFTLSPACEPDRWPTTLPNFHYSTELSNGIRHLLNDQGACGTYGDANSDYLEQILRKYYVHEVEGLNYFQVTSEFLFTDTSDPTASARTALDYILSQDCIDHSLLQDGEHLEFGLGCACANEDAHGNP